MTTFIETVQAATQKLEQAQLAYAQAQSRYATVKALNGQSGYTITIGGQTIVVAENAGRDGGWSARVRRGCELIHLGALKALDGEVDAALARVHSAYKYLDAVVASGCRNGLSV